LILSNVCIFIASASQLCSDWTTSVATCSPVRNAFAIRAVAIHAGLSSHCIGKAAKTDGERAISQRDVIGHAQAAPRPCGAQSNFIPGIDFEWQAELQSSMATWSRSFARPLACCTCFDVHQFFRASPVAVMRSSGWFFALSLRKS
jgi:hypothetical protein